MKMAIVGSRTFNDYDLLLKKCLDLVLQYKIKTIVSGGARGADSLAKKFANRYNLEFKEYLPDWNKNGRAAGMIRNRLIIEEADVVVAFWDGKSSGTKHSISLAHEEYKETFVVRF